MQPVVHPRYAVRFTSSVVQAQCTCARAHRRIVTQLSANYRGIGAANREMGLSWLRQRDLVLVLVLVMVTSSAIELNGDNVCHRVEK